MLCSVLWFKEVGFLRFPSVFGLVLSLQMVMHKSANVFMDIKIYFKLRSCFLICFEGIEYNHTRRAYCILLLLFYSKYSRLCDCERQKKDAPAKRFSFLGKGSKNNKKTFIHLQQTDSPSLALFRNFGLFKLFCRD